MRKRGCGQASVNIGCGRVRRSGSCPPSPRDVVLRTFDDVVDAFIAAHRERIREELEFYRKQPTFEDVVRVAALSIKDGAGKRHDHQRRIPGSSLRAAWHALPTAALRRAENFDALHGLVASATRGIFRIGRLARYDIPHRIGAWLRMEPDKVYLHAGAREGARAFGVRGDIVDKRGFPEGFQRLTPAEIEDCLCIYRDDLKRIARREAMHAWPRQTRASHSAPRPTV